MPKNPYNNIWFVHSIPDNFSLSPYFLPFFDYYLLFDKNLPKMMIFYSLYMNFVLSVINMQPENDHFKV